MSRLSTPLLFIVACSGFFAMTLNWFDLSAGSAAIAAHFHVGMRGVALMVSLFLGGYGVFHIPAGVWVRRYGIRRVVVTGLVVESMAAGLVGLAPTVQVVWGLRLAAGTGAALVAGAELALVTRLYRGRHLARAQGVASSAVYGLGALTGLGLWRPLIHHWGSGMGLLLAGLVGLAIAGLHAAVLTPQTRRSSPSDTWPSLRRVLRHRNLWWIGLGSMGGYGAYFTLSQLGPAIASSTFHTVIPAFWYGDAMLAAGILGALIGGYGSDIHHTRKWFILGPGLALAGWLLVWPHLGGALTLFGFMISGFLAMLPRPAYTATPGDDRHHIPAPDVATAEGVVFTLLSIGGAALPLLFGVTSAAVGGKTAWDALGAAVLICSLAALPMRDILVLRTTPKRSRPRPSQSADERQALTGDSPHPDL